MRRPPFLAPVLALLIAGVGAATPVAVLAGTAAIASAPAVSVSVPRSTTRGRLAAIRLTLPTSVAAIDGRVMLGRGARLMGVAAYGAGTTLRPVSIKGGAAFGAYGLQPSHGRLIVDLVVLAKKAGKLQARVVIDSASTRAGLRMALAGTEAVATLGVSRGTSFLAAARPEGRPLTTALPQPARELIVDGRINKRDLDAARAAWETARLTGRECRPTHNSDVNADGCVDIVDVQATLAGQGRWTSAVTPNADPPAGDRTHIVTSTADTPDALPGDGLCADSLGRCTLRAALAESDYLQGVDRIDFNLSGTAPVTIQLTSRLPIIASRAGGVIINGYSQPGSQKNTATVGSNAIPGVEIRGNGQSAREIGLRVTSPNNIIRGLVIQNVWRGIMLDGVDAHDNKITGNWIGLRRDGTNSGFGQYGIVVNVGANHNQIGTPDLDDRNLIANYAAGIDMYGPGVDYNVIMNNVFCLRPTGFLTGTCSTAIDHNFGPKHNTFGGDGTNEKNVIGPTYLQGIEYSHGWNPSLPPRTAHDVTYSIDDNTATGNWVGFRGDGSYSASYRSGLNFSSGDNGNGINVYDGVYTNTIQRNYVASVYDGIQTEGDWSGDNIFRGNIIGVSPLGENAPLTRWGFIIRWSTSFATIQNNTIRNAAAGGIGLVSTNNQNAYTAPAFNIRITRNIISDTNGPAIDLFGIAGADPNDVGDGDQGANTLLNTPVILDANTATVSGTADSGSTVEVYRANRPAGSYGLPVEFLGDAVVGGNGNWSVAVAGLAIGDRVTSLQIEPDGNTSELSVNVLVGNAPPPTDLIANDDFERTVSPGWGNAVKGGTWNHNGGSAEFSVSGGQGRLSLAAGQTREARLPIGATDLFLLGKVSFDRLPGSGNEWAYILARQNGNTAYRATIRVNPAGAVFVQLKRAVNNAETSIAGEVAVAGLTATPGMQLAFRFRVVGTNLQFRVWNAAGAEPGSPQTTATDTTASLQVAGGVGLRGYIGSAVPNGPVLVTLDDLEAHTP